MPEATHLRIFFFKKKKTWSRPRKERRGTGWIIAWYVRIILHYCGRKKKRGRLTRFSLPSSSFRSLRFSHFCFVFFSFSSFFGVFVFCYLSVRARKPLKHWWNVMMNVYGGELWNDVTIPAFSPYRLAWEKELFFKFTWMRANESDCEWRSQIGRGRHWRRNS